MIYLFIFRDLSNNQIGRVAADAFASLEALNSL